MNLAKKIDHTILKAEASTATVKQYCEEARQYGFASVCVNTVHVAQVAEALAGSDVKVCCVVGFPLGAMSTEAKAMEARIAVEAGADEVDMVLNIGALKEGNDALAQADMEAVVKASGKSIVKVIIETCLLTEEEIVRACKLAVTADAAFVKTSTGFSTGGATIEAVTLMKSTVGDRAQVKASGGIRTYEQAMALIAAGADRIGAGNGVALLDQKYEG